MIASKGYDCANTLRHFLFAEIEFDVVKVLEFDD